jgi:hypothetical protein
MRSCGFSGKNPECSRCGSQRDLRGGFLHPRGGLGPDRAPDRVSALAKRLNPAAPVVVIPQADHFYGDGISHLETALADAL